MRMSSLALATAIAGSLALAGCGGGDSRSSAAPAAAASGNPTVFVPTITPAAGTDFKRPVGDTLAILAVEPSKLTITQDKDSTRATGMGSTLGDKTKYVVTTKDVATFEPDKLNLMLSLKNNGATPISYDGMKIEYLIAGKPVNFYQSSEGLSASEVPKDGTTFIRLAGPKIMDLKEGDTVHIAVHGLPTKVKNAGDKKTTESTDLNFDGVIAAQQKVELKTVTTSEWK
ncbi:MAG: hypothetical protein H0W83_11955 [Planctomycetes bacterium]|nr:hypothetical protein [Planctomycetota bacterium]